MTWEITPEPWRGTRPRSIVSRRRLLTWAAIGGVSLAVPPRILARGPETGNQSAGARAQDLDDDTYVGPVHGHAVRWDNDVWNHSSSVGADLDYDYDSIDLSSATIYGLAQVRHDARSWVDLADAGDNAFDAYLTGLGQTRDEAEVLGQWTSDQAVGTLFYWLDYDDVPYTYVEFAPTEAAAWSVSYIQLFASTWDVAVAAALYKGIWIDDLPLIRATGVGDILAEIVLDAG